MTQTYASRVDARPGYASLKNRKKELRRQARRPNADLVRIDNAWLDAEETYRNDPRRKTDAGREWYRRLDLARVWAQGHTAAAAACGDETCPAALGTVCVCRCGGVNHGAAVTEAGQS